MSEVQGFATVNDHAGPYNAERLRILNMISKLATNQPVEVMAVHTQGVDPVGFVDVRPMIGQRSADGTITPHGTIPNVPYFRLQGGANAVIIDPEVGDIGLGCFSSRDLTSVKNARQAAGPGSERLYDMSDCMYVGGLLNGTPTQYILFNASGITVLSPVAVTVQAPEVQASCQTASITASISATITAPLIQLGAAGQSLLKFITSAFQSIYNNHVHSNGNGGANTGIPTSGGQMTAAQQTSTVQGG